MDQGLWRGAPGIGAGVFIGAMRKVAMGGLTCLFALCGALIGSVSGALTGQTTETGLVRGAAVGAVSGAVVSLEVLESCLQGELLSKVAMFGSLLNGKIFNEWVSPAILKAYLWQINTLEADHGDTSDIFDTDRRKCLSLDVVNKLPMFKIDCAKMTQTSREISCTICLQDFSGGDIARRLPTCGHLFHMHCIDEWLVRQASCPICRQDMCDV